MALKCHVQKINYQTVCKQRFQSHFCEACFKVAPLQMVPFYQESQIASSDTLWTPKSVLQMAGGLQLYKWHLRSEGIVLQTCYVTSGMSHLGLIQEQTSRFHHTILPMVAGSFFISRAVFKYIKLPPYFLAFHGQNNAFSRAVFRFLRLPP